MNARFTPSGAVTWLASLAKSGLMPKLGAASATLGGFTVTGGGGPGSTINTSLATASVAGALSAADFTKLATLQVPVLRLSYVASTDIMSGAAVAAATWVDLTPNQNFTAASAASWLSFQVRLGYHASCAGGATSIAARIVLDSAGTPRTYPFAAGFIAAAGQFGALSGGFLLDTTLAAGAHTVKLQVWGDLATVGYCRASSNPNIEWATILVAEWNP